MSRNCPICNSDQKTYVYKQNFNNTDFTPFSYYWVVICNHCNFVYADVNTNQQQLSDYYKSMSKYEYHSNAGNISKETENRFNNIFNFLQPHIIKESSILDIGCATGALLSIFKKNGYEDVTGVDPSESCCKIAKEYYDVNVIHSDIFKFKTEKKYDLIILSGVLEHIYDLQTLIKQVKEMLSETGMLFIVVPDVRNFYNKLQVPFQQFSTEHLQYFDIISLRKLSSLYEIDSTENLENEFDPVLFVLFKNTPTNWTFVRGDYSSIAVNSYIQQSNKLETKLLESIENKLKNVEQFIVWGVGTSTLRLLNNGLDVDKISFFIDSNENYNDKQIYNKFIWSPDEYGDHLKMYDTSHNLPIVITSYISRNEIKQQIKDLGIKNKIIDLYEE
jgi:2-polyprenyl-3-methyl-5-hydroxy-6-metoxy-1,4-benzoquinol methylase